MEDRYYFDYEREMLYDKNGDIFIAVIWPTAIKYEREIIQMINEFSDIYLYDKECIIMKRENLLWIMYWIYHFDWIPQKIVEEKCKVISQAIKGETIEMIFLKLYSKDKKYTTNAHNNRKQATITSLIKYKVRQAIKEKIDNYVHDIIVHITDDGNQSYALIELIVFLRILNNNDNLIAGYDYDGRYLKIRLCEKIASIDEIKNDWLVIEAGENGR